MVIFVFMFGVFWCFSAMNFSPPQHIHWEATVFWISKRRGNVSANFAGGFASHPAGWMQRFSRRTFPSTLAACALVLAACSRTPPIDPIPTPAPATPAPVLAAVPSQPPPTAPVPEPPADTAAIERRFVSAQSDPAERIAAVRELITAPTAAALALMNRLYPIERREDVKMEMLTLLADLDHESERDSQLALCTKAMAHGQPPMVRYVAIHTIADLRDPRARALLIPLLSDSDREVRTAATQALRDLKEQ